MIDVAVIAIAIESTKLKVDDETRLRYAADIAATAPDIETGLALVSTIKAEAEMDPTRIERCRYLKGEGDNGRASGLYQLHPERLQGHSKEEVCADNRLASKLAADFLSHLRRVTGSWRAAFRRYVGCSTESDPRLRERGKHFETLVANARRAS